MNSKELIRSITNSDGFTAPLYIYNFINKLSILVNPKTHPDPWLIPSSPCNFFDFAKTKAYCINNTAFETIKAIFGNPKTEIHLAESWQFLDTTNNKFDFITCFPPFGMRKEPTEINGFKTTNDFVPTLLRASLKTHFFI